VKHRDYSEEVWDIVILGGGLAGCAAAAEAAREGLKVLILERRPVMCWELCWAHAPRLDAGGGWLHQELQRRLSKAGLPDAGRPDPAISEIVLDEIWEDAAFHRLHHMQPIRLLTSGGIATSVVAAGKNGQAAFRARCFIDASEKGFFWKQAGAGRPKAAREKGRFSAFFWLPAPARSEAKLGDIGAAHDAAVLPGPWENSAELAFMVRSASIADARVALPAVLREARKHIDPAAIVTHTAPELLPLTAPRLPGNVSSPHPAVANMFGAGLWLSDPVAVEELAGSLLASGAAAGRAAAAAVAAFPEPPPCAEAAQVAPPQYHCDILVAGAGTAGAVAAITAARRNHKVTVLEAGTSAGGIATTGGIHSYCVGLPGGIQDEIDRRVSELAPLFGPPDKVAGFHPEAKKTVLEIMLREAGADVRYGVMLVGAISRQVEGITRASAQEEPVRRIQAAITASAQGSATWSARVFVDCTGDADLAAWTGARYTFGREADGLPHAYSLSSGRIRDGKMIIVNFDAGYTDPTDAADVTRARYEALKLYRRPSYTADDRPTYIAPLIGIRSSRQVVCDAMLTLSDQVGARRFPDAIAETWGFHDNHGYDYEFESDQSLFYVWVLGYWGRPLGYEIPYGTLLPKGVEGLLVACRACGLTHDAHMSFRMQNDMQRLGEAAGLAAALSVETGRDPRQVDVSRLRELLMASGALRPPTEKPRFMEKLEQAMSSWKALPDPDSPSRVAAELEGPRASSTILLLASAQPESPSYSALLEAARASDKPVARFRAAAILAMRRDPRAVPALIETVRARLSSTPSPECNRVRADVPAWIPAAALLGRLKARESVPELLSVLEDRDLSLDGLLAVVRALGRIGDPQAAPALERLAARKDIPATRKLQVSMGNAQPAVLDARWQVDLAIAEALAAMGAPREALIKPYLEDSRLPVRRRARAVLDLSRQAASDTFAAN